MTGVYGFCFPYHLRHELRTTELLMDVWYTIHRLGVAHASESDIYMNIYF